MDGAPDSGGIGKAMSVHKTLISTVRAMARSSINPAMTRGSINPTHGFVGLRTELDALPRPRRPVDPENADRIREFLESELYISQKTLSKKLNLQHNPVHRILTEELGVCKVNFKWIPHSLAESLKQEHVRTSMGLLGFLKESSPQKLAHVFTGDESWRYMANPQKPIWFASGVPRTTRTRRNVEARKVMIWIYFSKSGSSDLAIFTHGERLNRKFVIDEVSERYDEHQSAMRKKN
jgi:hypothetical protein